MTAIPCAIIRGGTSKGVFILDRHLPADPAQRDRLLIELMGSPDPRQIDGLGGADPLTSKVAIVSPSSRPGIDVEYESLEVGIADARVNHGLMCGNLAAGVGHFALAEGLIEARSPVTEIRIHCRSNQKLIVASVAEPEAPVRLAFHNPGGAVTGRLLPAAEPLSVLAVAPGREFEVSIVDAGTLYAFVPAAALGLNGSESVAALDHDEPFRATIEALRHAAAAHLACCDPARLAGLSPRRIKVAVVGPATGPDHDIAARVINTAKVHKAYAVSGGICLAAAAAIPGTLVHRLVPPPGSPFTLRIGHPSGTLALQTRWSAEPGGVRIHAAEIERSARVLLRGVAYVASTSAPASAPSSLPAAGPVADRETIELQA